MLILALPLISIIFKNKLGSFETDCRCGKYIKIQEKLKYLVILVV